MRSAYGFYSRRLLPVLGGLISGSRRAYSYLPESISAFPHPAELLEMLSAAGFVETRYELLTRGVAALHIGMKPRSSSVA
jgi:demethylmenaquinone methyltransferase/2-methoxy-6-polyprenyl-1,4-benzoquinol methylase